MKFYQWFNKQSLLIKVLLMIIPVVNWICELLIRGSVFLKKKSITSLLVLLLYVFVGWGEILEIIDIIWLVLKGHLILAK